MENVSNNAGIVALEIHVTTTQFIKTSLPVCRFLDTKDNKTLLPNSIALFGSSQGNMNSPVYVILTAVVKVTWTYQCISL